DRQATVIFEGRTMPLVVGVKGILNKNFTLTPARVELDAGRQATFEVTIFNETDSALTVKGIDQIPTFLEATLSKDQFAPRDPAVLRVSIKPKSKIPRGGYEGTLLVRTDSAFQPTIPVPIRIDRAHP